MDEQTEILQSLNEDLEKNDSVVKKNGREKWSTCPEIPSSPIESRLKSILSSEDNLDTDKLAVEIKAKFQNHGLRVHL